MPGKFTPDYRMRILANSEKLIVGGVKSPLSLLSVIAGLPEGDVKGLELPDGSRLMKPMSRRGRKITVWEIRVILVALLNGKRVGCVDS